MFERLFGISKRGDAYLRGLDIHGAKAMIRKDQAEDDGLSRAIMRTATTRHQNIVVVVLALR